MGSAAAVVDAFLHFPNDLAQLITDSQIGPGSALADKAAFRRDAPRRDNDNIAKGEQMKSKCVGRAVCSRMRASADARPFPDDPQVARPLLKPIDRCRQVTRGRRGRPALADASELAETFQILQPAKRLVVAESCRSGGHRGRERAGQIHERGSHAIRPARGIPPISRVRLRWRGGRLCGGGQTFRCGCRVLWGRRTFSETGSAVRAQNDRFTSVTANDLKRPPSPSGTAHATAASSAFQLGQIFGSHRHLPSR